MPLEFDRSNVAAERIEVAEAVDAAEPEATPVPVADFGGRRVLVVDDEVQNLLALTPLLEQWGIQVEGAGDGQEALDTLVEDPDMDLVLLDMMLPGLDGLETARRLRALPGLARVPVVLVTGYPVDAARAQAAGVTEILGRPLEADALYAALVRLWGAPAPAAAAG
jgi:CheY-like chemotaxis protein